MLEIINKKLMQLPDELSFIEKKTLNLTLSLKIPFNRPHQVEIIKLNKNTSIASLPYKRSNLNHLGGIHACAQATLGEFCAGVLLLRNLGLIDYRLIMRSLKINFYKQSKTTIKAVAKLDLTQQAMLNEDLAKCQEAEIKMQTQILDDKDNLIADVETDWHLKSWKACRYK
jgi:acyl-coenzyme A thioesterase PaaI-like protein